MPSPNLDINKCSKAGIIAAWKVTSDERDRLRIRSGYLESSFDAKVKILETELDELKVKNGLLKGELKSAKMDIGALETERDKLLLLLNNLVEECKNDPPDPALEAARKVVGDA